MLEGSPPTAGARRPLPPPREIATGIVLGLVVGLVLWVVILQLFGGVNHHFTFAP